MSVLEALLDRAAAYTRKFVREESTLWRWATVTSVDPVKIRYDGASDPALITPTVLGVPVGVGDRVRTATVRGQTCIIRANGHQVFRDGDVFESVASGVDLLHATAVVEPVGGSGLRRVSLQVETMGFARQSGNQNTLLGTLVGPLCPGSVQPAYGVVLPGASMFNITTFGNVRLRWSTTSGSGLLCIAASYLVED